MTADDILTRLVELSHQIEAYRAAVYVMELERTELLGQLRLSGWKPPPLPEKA